MLGFGNKYKKENKLLKDEIKGLRLEIKNILFSHQVYRERMEIKSKPTLLRKLSRWLF